MSTTRNTTSTGATTTAGSRCSVFISYRRSDAEHAAGRIADRLRAELEENAVFLDTHEPTPGPFPDRVRKALTSAQVVLAVIGDTWQGAQDPDTKKRRLDDTDDWVRTELALALRPDSGKTVLVLLVGRAQEGPAASWGLPTELERLPYQQSYPLRSGQSWDSDMRAILDQLKPLVLTPLVEPPPEPPAIIEAVRGTAPSSWSSGTEYGILVELDTSGETVRRNYRNARGAFGTREIGSRTDIEGRFRGLCAAVTSGDPARLRDELGGARRHQYGQDIFKLLFNEEDLSKLFESPGATPLRRGLRVRIQERMGRRPPLFDDLPWRIATWKDHPLVTPGAPNSWRFELAWPDANGVAPPSKRIDVPCRILVIAAGEPSLHETHLRSLRQILAIAAEHTPRKVEHLTSVVRTSEALRAAPSAEIIYVLSDPGSPDVLPRKALFDTLSKRRPGVIILTGLASASEARNLLASIPVVLTAPRPASNVLGWFHEVLLENREPVDAVHTLPAMDDHIDAHAIRVAAHFERFEVVRPVPAGRVRVNHSLDRAAQRGIALGEVNKLLSDGDRRVQAFVAWGTPSDAPHLIGTQLLEHVRRQAHGPPAVKPLKPRIPEERSDLAIELAGNIRAQLGLEDPNLPLESGLRKTAPAGHGTRRPLLWLDFGVYGDGSTDEGPYRKPLMMEHLRTWWRFCCHELAPACPKHVRLVAVIALVPNKLAGFQDRLEG